MLYYYTTTLFIISDADRLILMAASRLIHSFIGFLQDSFKYRMVLSNGACLSWE